MGAWGTAISSNDTYADIYEEFIDLYNEGHSVEDITTHLINQNQETINIKEDASNFWYAIANAQWECKALNSEILSKVEGIITSGEDLRIWKELDASDKDLKARAIVLDKFLAKIRVEKDKPRKRVKKKLCDSIFKKGDCLTYIMDNGNYGGSFVLSDELNTEVGINYIAITTINKSEKPTIVDFKYADIYVQNRENSRMDKGKLIQYREDEPLIGGFYAMLFKKHGFDIEVIGQIPFKNEFKMEKETFCNWSVLKTAIPFKEEYIKINGPATQSLRLIDLISSKGIIENLKSFFGFK